MDRTPDAQPNVTEEDVAALARVAGLSLPAERLAPLTVELNGALAIVAELAAVQGEPVDIGGYYRPDAARVAAVMRPSATFAAALAVLEDGA